MRVDTITPGPELADVPPRPGPVQLTLEDAPQRRDERAVAITVQIHGQCFRTGQTADAVAAHLTECAHLVQRVLDDYDREADRRLGEIFEGWEPSCTPEQVTAAIAWHRQTPCDVCQLTPEDHDG